MTGKKRKRRASSANEAGRARDARESGEPGGGKGRRDDVGASGVYPPGAERIPPDAEVKMAGSWGGGDYDESGGSELIYRDGQLLGGTTAGPDGEPTIDIHGRGDRASDARSEAAPADDEKGAETDATIAPVELRSRGLPSGRSDVSAQGDTHGTAHGEPREGERE
ncbi:MAG TPA: hypothetical protein VFK04_12290 [Gemmatimonadaceae bacterium]|nr:hypothetical protein [Gemmatimonadaceae bacterium]